ncbi:MAG: hypothetical protein LBJ32_03910 [Oscillospiraceae bacterium]|jgi:hypothetical protein|nr:hypothetical protein [Oscillospiraceae bacterium]
MCKRRNSCSAIICFLGILVFIFSIMLAIFLIFDHKKKKEDKDLENYLENSIQ